MSLPRTGVAESSAARLGGVAGSAESTARRAAAPASPRRGRRARGCSPRCATCTCAPAGMSARRQPDGAAVLDAPAARRESAPARPCARAESARRRSARSRRASTGAQPPASRAPSPRCRASLMTSAGFTGSPRSPGTRRRPPGRGRSRTTAASDARKTAAPASSSTRPKRCIGVRVEQLLAARRVEQRASSDRCGRRRARSRSRSRSRGAHSTARARVRPAMPALLAV